MPLPKKTHKLLLKNQNSCLIEVKSQRSRPKPSAANDNPEQKKENPVEQMKIPAQQKV